MIRFFRKYHKWIGLFFAFFIIMFALSGIFLNHRKPLSQWDVSRKYLPKSYRYSNWNNGAIVGTKTIAPNKIIMYGNSGVWLTDSLMENITPFVDGLSNGIDNQSLRATVITPNGTLFGVTYNQLYTLSEGGTKWIDISEKINAPYDTFNDLTTKGDTLFVLMRSYIYQSIAPYNQFEKIDLPTPENYSNSVSLFKTIWILHSGEIWGVPGKIFIDFLGIIVILLTITGIILTFWKIPIKKRRKIKKDTTQLTRTWKFSLHWHNKLGSLLFVFLLILVVTGWFLRPPLLIPIARAKTKPVPFSTLDSKNPWNNKLRNLRFDKQLNTWVLYSSNGFYTFNDFDHIPQKMHHSPPVSVMGITVWEQATDSTWLVGSFSGIYEWNARNGNTIDAITHKPYQPIKRMGPPVFDSPISGYSPDFAFGNIYFSYSKGVFAQNSHIKIPTMPMHIQENGKMSFWHVNLELHVGRLYGNILGPLSPFFIFFSGLLFLFVLVSGYVVYRKRHKKRKK